MGLLATASVAIDGSKFKAVNNRDKNFTRAKVERRRAQLEETVEHPFGTMKARMGATHFLTKTLPKVAAEMALSVLAYNLTRVMNIVRTKPLIAAIAA
jgi:IS5 family transposase